MSGPTPLPVPAIIAAHPPNIPTVRTTNDPLMPELSAPVQTTTSPVESMTADETVDPPHPLASDAPVEDSISNQSAPAPVSAGPMCHVKALIISGESHVFSFEPEQTVGRTKELIWSMWPSQWTEPAQPPSPSFLRILHGGRILADESTLASNNIPSSTSSAQPTVIHISVRSFSLRPEDDPQKGSHLPGQAGRNGRGDDVGGCKCVIM
ncbi:ubiquitin-related domain-containing protein [Kockovaella imperatae]|uniref:Ubiquitin-related domain-containing protein n=1 Tax=Kockovaella imperatae TaxID=4999 RepID=A0A1Y1U7Q0_9TREE|nr:ubiquitin-related domain-containing protein [Kockovaella imperatae]ORX34038.1 ubiquitin-related domain-containing protein [Kockovaella imperatae]